MSFYSDTVIFSVFEQENAQQWYYTNTEAKPRFLDETKGKDILVSQKIANLVTGYENLLNDLWVMS